MKYTQNYNLALPDSGEYYNVRTGNNNFNLTDELLKILRNSVDSLDDTQIDSAIDDAVDEIKDTHDLDFDTLKELGDYVNTDNGEIFTNLNQTLNSKTRKVDIDSSINDTYLSIMSNFSEYMVNNLHSYITDKINKDTSDVYGSDQSATYIMKSDYTDMVSRIGKNIIDKPESIISNINTLISKMSGISMARTRYKSRFFNTLTNNDIFLATIYSIKNYISITDNVESEDVDSHNLTISICIPHNIHEYSTNGTILDDAYSVDNETFYQTIRINPNDYPTTKSLYINYDYVDKEWSITNNAGTDSLYFCINIEFNNSDINWVIDPVHSSLDSLMGYKRPYVLHDSSIIELLAKNAPYTYLGDVTEYHQIEPVYNISGVDSTIVHPYNVIRSLCEDIVSVAREISTISKSDDSINILTNMNVMNAICDIDDALIAMPTTIESTDIPASAQFDVFLTNCKIDSNTTNSPKQLDGLLTQRLMRNDDDIIRWTLTVYYIDGSIYQKSATVNIFNDGIVIEWDTNSYIMIKDDLSLGKLFDKTINKNHLDYYLDEISI